MKNPKFNLLLIVAVIGHFSMFAADKKPIVETFEASARVRSGIAMGGIGTGSVEIRKDGNFYNWSIFNNYPKGTGPIFDLPITPGKQVDQSFLFFIVRYQVEGEKPKLKLLQLNNSLNEGGIQEIVYYYPWMRAVDKIQYSARFPFSNFVFSDAEMPFDVEMEAFSPFIPHDVKNSSLPGAYFNFNIKSKTEKKVDVMLLGSLRNLVGYDQINKAFDSKLIEGNGYKFFSHCVTGIADTCATYGQMGLGAIGGEEVSYYLGWENKHPYYERILIESKLPNIDDTKNRNFKMDDGLTVGRFGAYDNDQRCFSTISVSKELKGKTQFSTTFFMNWNFPNYYGSVREKVKKTIESREKKRFEMGEKLTKNLGHFYQNSFSSINEISNYFVANFADLSTRSHQFVNDMYSSDLDLYVLDQVNSNLNTFVTSSTLTKSGQYGIREGLTPTQAWGPNSTADVAMYGSPMIIALFPELQKTMMRTHKKLQTPEGEINHGLGFDLDYSLNGTFGVYHRIDLVPDYIQMVMRDYLVTNDKAYLKEMWPSIVNGIDYILTKRDKDGDQMPEMDGIMCSYDNFPMYGLASYIQSQWIASLTMASQAAADLGDKVLEKKYKEIARKGSQLMESKLWNGNYYNLSNDYLGKKGVDDGCLTDQLIGQWTAHNAGVGYLFDKEKVQKALKSILSRSFMDNSFLRNCSWPATPDLFPIHSSDLWVDHPNTPWTGVELAFASFLIYENMVEDGLKVIKAVDDRYRKAGLYFDHQEFGGHYFRPMSSWTILNAFLGFSSNRGLISFNPKLQKNIFTLFFATPDGTQLYKKGENSVIIEVKTGEMKFSKLKFENSGVLSNKPQIYLDGKMITSVKIEKTNTAIIVSFVKDIKVDSGSKIELR